MGRPAKIFSLAVALAASLGAPASARASDLDQFGFGARPMAMGGAFTALASDFTGTYYNPGALGAAESVSVGGGFSYAAYDLEFRGEDPRFDDRVERQQPLSVITIGVSASLGEPGTFIHRITPALGVLIPTRQIVGVEAQTGPGRPEFFLYGSRRDKLGVLPAVAFKILPAGDIGQTLSIGVGATVLADINGEFRFDLDDTPDSSISTDLKLEYDVAPNVGVFWWPVDWLSFGLCYRGKLSLKADFDVDIELTGDDDPEFPLRLEAITLWQPQQVAIGLAVDPFDWMTLAFDVTWQDWSAFDDPFITLRPIVAQIDPDFEDVFVPRVGVEIEPVRWLAFRLGYYYQESPIPAQSGETTLVDLDKHVISFGIGWDWWTTREVIVREGDTLRLEEEEAHPLSVDAFFQWHHLLEDRVEKDDPASSPVGASYRASGEIFNIGIEASLKF